jgi:hypothetical protein
MMGKNNGLKKITTKNLTNKYLWTFEWLDMDLIFKSPNLGHFLLDLYFFPPYTYVKKFFRWVAFYMSFINWLITT